MRTRTALSILLFLCSTTLVANSDLCECFGSDGSFLKSQCVRGSQECSAFCGIFDARLRPRAGTCPDAPPRQFSRAALKAHVVWAIAHEGCVIISGDSLLPADQLRQCYVDKERVGLTGNQPNEDALFQLQHATDAMLIEVTQESIADVHAQAAQINLPEHFRWVCDHEGQGKRFHDAVASGDLNTVRAIFAEKQRQQPTFRNFLYAFTDSDLRALVQNSCPAVSPPKPSHEPPSHPEHP